MTVDAGVETKADAEVGWTVVGAEFVAGWDGWRLEDRAWLRSADRLPV